MYIDLIVFVILLVLVIMFFKRFSSFVFFVAIFDITLRILTFIKNNIPAKDISAVIGIFAADILVKAIENLNDYMVALGGEPYDTSGFMTSQIIVSLIMVGLGIGIQMFKNRVCALIGLVGSAINVLATFSAYHKFGGWYLFLAFCYATAATFALNQRWNEYERTGKCHGVI